MKKDPLAEIEARMKNDDYDLGDMKGLYTEPRIPRAIVFLVVVAALVSVLMFATVS